LRDLQLRALTVADAASVLSLYREVASAPNCGLARAPDEMSAQYVEAFLARASSHGVAIGAFADNQLVGEIHAARIGPRQFSHVLTELTVAVRPGMQGRGVGATLFSALFRAAARLRPPIARIELIARSGNAAAIQLYERLGFSAEGRFVGRVRLRDGHIEDDIPMARSL